MVDNNPIRTSSLFDVGTSRRTIAKNESIRSQEHLNVTYQIEKNSGIRMNKKLNSFKAAPSTSLKAIVKTVIKKVKFSTRHKYEILYFDPVRSRWKKFKDTSDWQDKNHLKIRVCRYKSTQSKPTPKPSVSETKVGSDSTLSSPMSQNTQRMNYFQFNPSMVMYLYSYYCFMQMNSSRFNPMQ